MTQNFEIKKYKFSPKISFNLDVFTFFFFLFYKKSRHALKIHDSTLKQSRLFFNYFFLSKILNFSRVFFHFYNCKNVFVSLFASLFVSLTYVFVHFSTFCWTDDRDEVIFGHSLLLVCIVGLTRASSQI